MKLFLKFSLVLPPVIKLFNALSCLLYILYPIKFTLSTLYCDFFYFFHFFCDFLKIFTIFLIFLLKFIILNHLFLNFFFPTPKVFVLFLILQHNQQVFRYYLLLYGMELQSVIYFYYLLHLLPFVNFHYQFL